VSASQQFPCEVASVRAARRFVVGAMGAVSQEHREAIELMVSELATNCIRHADSPFTVIVDATADAVRIEVADSGAGQPRIQEPDLRSPSGRGLRIVETLADAWGIEAKPSGGGKSVWFTVELSDQSAAVRN
jgi:anti-sigma regulatory factor (Ser/Thr protein kinase)